MKTFYNNIFEYPNINDDIVMKYIQVLQKYYNEDYDKLSKNITNENINLYFKNIDISKLIIDLFNMYTYFYFEDKLKKYSCIKHFLDYYFNYYYINTLLRNMINNQKIVENILYYNLEKDLIDDLTIFSLVYDIGLYLNFCENFENYDYNVIYSGNFHKELFDIFIKFVSENDRYTSCLC